jgi:hypothetical protein
MMEAFFIGKRAVMSGGRTALFIHENPQEILKDKSMVIFFSAMLNEIYRLGREYPFPRPKVCPGCQGCRLWGHGFVLAAFDGYCHPLCLKRYRCPDCRCVVCLRPDGYFSRFQASIEAIRSSVVSKVRIGKWLAGISRSRQRHWFNALVKRIKAYLTDVWQDVLAGFDYFVQSGQIPVSRSI